MMLTASIQLLLTPEDSEKLLALGERYIYACNLLVPSVCEHRVWNRVDLHKRAYYMLRDKTDLKSQFCCNVIFSVCKAYKSMKGNGRIQEEKPVPKINFKKISVHYDKRTYTLKGDSVSLTVLEGKRVKAGLILCDHQRAILASGTPKEAELVLRKNKWYFNLVVESPNPPPIQSGSVMGTDVGENNLAATSTGKVIGGGNLKHKRNRHLAYRRRLQFNGSKSAKQKLKKVSGKERRRVSQINHETAKAIVQEALRIGAKIIVLEDLTHIRERIKAGKRVRTRLHRWAFRELQSFIKYKAEAVGIEVVFVDPAYTSQTCSSCGALGNRVRHRFVCPKCGLRAHADVNAGRNLARMGGTNVPSRAV